MSPREQRTLALGIEGIGVAVFFALYSTGHHTFGLFELVILAVIGFVMLNLFGIFQDMPKPAEPLLDETDC